jgi:hypothetical protein
MWKHTDITLVKPSQIELAGLSITEDGGQNRVFFKSIAICTVQVIGVIKLFCPWEGDDYNNLPLAIRVVSENCHFE